MVFIMNYENLSIFSYLEELLVGNVQTLLDKSADLIASISPIFSLAFGVYVLLQVFHYYNKGLDDSLVDIIKRMLAWIIIIALAFNASGYKELARTAYDLPNALSEVVSGEEYKAATMDDNYASLNQNLAKIDKLSGELGAFDVGDHVGFYILKVVVQFTLSLLMIFCFAYYLVAKMSLILVLMFGPIFIGFLLFPATRQWGMSWINQVANYSLAAACYVLIGLMQQEFITQYLIKTLGKMSSAEEIMVYLFMITSISIFAMVVFILVSWNIPAVVTGLVGGGTFAGHFRSLPNLNPKSPPKSQTSASRSIFSRTSRIKQTS